MSPRPRLAWFSPMPPVRSGVATVSADLLPLLRGSFDIDVFVDAGGPVPSRVEGAATASRSAHDFLWLNAQAPYDLCVYQLGNSSVHDYIWPYLFRYPGLAVLHDAHLHHARAAALLRARRKSDYRREFTANHPDANPDLAELVVAGFDNHIFYHWPMTRLVVERSRLTAVHADSIARELLDDIPGAAVEAIRLGHGRELTAQEAADARAAVRARHAIPDEAVVFGCFGGLSPEKRLPQILAAFSAIRSQVPYGRLLLAGQMPAHYDLAADVAGFGLEDCTTVTGYLSSEAELAKHIAASDIALNLRWPTAREISGPWLRCLAAARATIVIDLAQLAGIPSLDPRSWRSNAIVATPTGAAPASPVCVAVDILDEDHSLRLAMHRLARDAALRDALGQAGRAYWRAHHTPELMAEDYRRIIAAALAREAQSGSAAGVLPAHVLKDGTEMMTRVLGSFGLKGPFGNSEL